MLKIAVFTEADVDKAAEYITVPSSLGGIPVFAIGDGAFKDCKNLKSVTLPEGIVSIGSAAFCSSLEQVNIPESVMYIDKYSFSNTNVREIIMHDNVIELGWFVFTYCRSLSRVRLSEKLQNVGPNVFSHCVSLESIYIPSSLKTITYAMFQECSSLSEVTIAEGVEVIGGSAFELCTALTEIIIPEGVKKIEENAFMDCENLVSAELPDSLQKIDEGAFLGCSSLSSIYLPDGLEKIELDSFARCASLEEFDVSENNRYFSSEDGVLFNKSMDKLILYPMGKCVSEYYIPECVSVIGNFAFCDCAGIEKIIIHEYVEYIGECAFANCEYLCEFEVSDNNRNYMCEDSILYDSRRSKLIAYPPRNSNSSLILPDGLVRIENSAFFNSVVLEYIHFPESLAYIGDKAFVGCISLSCIEIPQNVSYIGEFAFVECLSLSQINVNEDNKYFYSIDGVLFDKRISQLICYPAGKTDSSYIVPDGTVSISRTAFGKNTQLTSLTIPKSVTNIHILTFGDCEELTDIYYLGNEEEWNSGKLKDISSAACDNVRIHFTE